MKWRRGCLLFFVGATLIAAGLIRGDMETVRRTSTYRDFDVASDQSGVQYLSPGLADRAHEGAYSFSGAIHKTPLIALGIVFLAFFLLRNRGSLDRKLGLARGMTQWGAFVVARLGVFRVAGVARVSRCGAGVFPFLNCQACEMATGACPIGQVQTSLLTGRVPVLAAGVLLATAGLLGRWICGWLCPFGLFSDIVDRTSARRCKPRHAWRAGGFVVAGLILVATLVFVAAGIQRQAPFCSTVCASGKLYGLLPYFSTTAAGDVAQLSGAGLAAFVYHAALFTVLIVALVLISGRAFCRYLCPLGALLGLGNRTAAVRVKHNAAACTGCDLCLDKCPMGIDLSRSDFLTQTGCIRCGRCIAICGQGARTWEYPWSRTLKPERNAAHGQRARKPVAQG